MEIHTIEPFVDYWQRVRSRTRAVAERIPEEHLEWRPGEGRFSPGDLVRHLAATERWLFVECARKRPSRYPGHGPELARGKDAVLSYLDRMHAESVEILEGFGVEDLEAPCTTVAGAEITTWKWLRAMVEHEVHHRGQLYQILGELGVATPPLYGLTERQVFEGSEPAPGQ